MNTVKAILFLVSYVPVSLKFSLNLILSCSQLTDPENTNREINQITYESKMSKIYES